MAVIVLASLYTYIDTKLQLIAPAGLAKGFTDNIATIFWLIPVGC